MFRKLRKLLHDHLVRPFKESVAPIHQVGWGAAVGMFVGILPIVGVQMYVVATLWILLRYVLRARFSLPIALAMVWISNPVTMGPMYYGYLVTGNWTLQFFDFALQPVSFAEFNLAFDALLDRPELSWGQRIWRGAAMVLLEFGWPILFGSFCWAIPLSLLAYPVTTVSLCLYRMKLAQGEGISYRDWSRKHVRPNSAARVRPLPPEPDS